MAQYSIRELEHLSGIKAHTIRIWEQRYNILQPKRTPTNIRYYDDADLRTILNISLLNAQGYKISRIAKMSPAEVAQEVMQLCGTAQPLPLQSNALLMAMISLDEEQLNKTLFTAVLQLGFEKTMLELVYPFLDKIGILWQTGNINPVHEHFVSNVVRQKLLVAIDGQVVRVQPGAKRYLLFLPEGELHELSLLFMFYLLRARQQQVLYLGQSLPFSDLQIACNTFRPDVICVAMTIIPAPDDVQTFLNDLSASFPDTRIYAYGYQAQHDFLVFPENVRKLTRITDFIRMLDE